MFNRDTKERQRQNVSQDHGAGARNADTVKFARRPARKGVARGKAPVDAVNIVRLGTRPSQLLRPAATVAGSQPGRETTEWEGGGGKSRRSDDGHGGYRGIKASGLTGQQQQRGAMDGGT